MNKQSGNRRVFRTEESERAASRCLTTDFGDRAAMTDRDGRGPHRQCIDNFRDANAHTMMGSIPVSALSGAAVCFVRVKGVMKI